MISDLDYSIKAKPFVKWVGGKTQLLFEIERRLPYNFMQMKDVTYIEPFVGGGSVLFWLLRNYSNIGRIIINDINKDLITAYRVVRAAPEELIELLRGIQTEYILLNNEDRKNYYLTKRAEYNSKSLNDVENSALFIFLNKTCFNGLYRVNSSGSFNVPHGNYANPNICDEFTIRADSKLLQRVEIFCSDFANMDAFANENALFYLDPPYKPVSSTSAFTAYSKGSFVDADHIRLRDFCEKISESGSVFILSNSDVKAQNATDNFFDDLYCQFYISRVFASRMVNSNGARRGKIPELMISNII